METKVQYMAATPYVIPSSAEGFMSFMQKVFGAKEIRRMADGGKILHAEIDVNGSVIMVADPAEFDLQPAGFNMYVGDVDGTYRKALENGAKSVMDVDDRSYGRSAGIRDPYGNLFFITGFPEDK